MIFSALLSVPLMFALGLFLLTKDTVTWKEAIWHVGISVSVAIISVIILQYTGMRDVEIWGGLVDSKAKEQVSCEHSYDCNCREVCSGSGNNISCSTECDTCYKHNYDYDWAFYTSDDGRHTVHRLDDQGLKEPQRWTQIIKGEPSASAHSYSNYIKAAPNTLFRNQGLIDKYKMHLPTYPGNVYDYYRINRLVLVGVQLPPNAVHQYTQLLMTRNAALGPLKQANLAVVLVSGLPSDYFGALEQYWTGGKKNDVIAVIGVKKGTLDISWVRIMCWSKNEDVSVAARNAISDVKTVVDPNAVVWALSDAVETKFVRKPMADFEYLKSSITPKPGEFAGAFILNLIISIGLGVFFHSNELRSWNKKRRYNRRTK